MNFRRDFLFLWVFPICGLAASCGLSGPLRTDPKAKSFDLGSLNGGWEKGKIEAEESSADLVYFNQRSSAYIAVNSICKRYPDSSLASLSKQLMAPMANAELVGQEKMMIDEREALSTRAKGLLDGVPVEAKFVVMRKNECIFDFSLVSSKQMLAEDEEAFNKMVSGFRFTGGIRE